mmetsp:Transcript_47895/g.148170  ORF Transcript_47895/g.148170 Transcript_47895/m.148170 type:complete len:232 (+) Transcript_47895:1103-1798(+)
MGHPPPALAGHDRAVPVARSLHRLQGLCRAAMAAAGGVHPARDLLLYAQFLGCSWRERQRLQGAQPCAPFWHGLSAGVLGSPAGRGRAHHADSRIDVPHVLSAHDRVLCLHGHLLPSRLATGHDMPHEGRGDAHRGGKAFPGPCDVYGQRWRWEVHGRVERPCCCADFLPLQLICHGYPCPVLLQAQGLAGICGLGALCHHVCGHWLWCRRAAGGRRHQRDSDAELREHVP